MLKETDKQLEEPLSALMPEKRAQGTSLAAYVADAVLDYFNEAQNRKEFEQWYEKRYGKSYTWKAPDNHS